MIELLVVIAILAILAGLLLKSMAAGKRKAQGTGCVSNERQLSMAWHMYADDNNDRLTLSSDDGTGQPFVAATPGTNTPINWAWAWSKMDFSASNPYNTDPNADIKLRVLYQYLKNPNLERCPADTSFVISNRVNIPRIRTISMNLFLGGFGDNSSLLPDDGNGWAPYYVPYYTKTTDLTPTRSPGPVDTYVFIDERQDVINWGNFCTDMSGFPFALQPNPNPLAYAWAQDVPASYHFRTAGISFADGHAVLHRWENDSTMPPLNSLQEYGTWAAPHSVDVAWMQNVTARPHQ